MFGVGALPEGTGGRNIGIQDVERRRRMGCRTRHYALADLVISQSANCGSTNHLARMGNATYQSAEKHTLGEAYSHLSALSAKRSQSKLHTKAECKYICQRRDQSDGGIAIILSASPGNCQDKPGLSSRCIKRTRNSTDVSPGESNRWSYTYGTYGSG